MEGSRLLAVVVVVLVQLGGGGVVGNLVFQVKNKFKAAGRERTLDALKEHDTRRHGRMLAVDFPMGGNGLPTETGLYYTKLPLGTPPADYYVLVDTGSDPLWVNCVGCRGCPTKSNIGIDLKLFDPEKSETSSVIKCDDQVCKLMFDKESPSRCSPGAHCQYNIAYGDESNSTGYVVSDHVQLAQVTGNLKTTASNATIVFGCGTSYSGSSLGSDAGVDGILGLGQANSSMLSQLAAAGMVKKEFAHCLDVVEGGGIFAIGDVVSPEVKTTPLVPDMPHYNVYLEGIAVGGDALNVPASIGAIIDSGTTLAYLPSVVYDSLVPKILAQQPGLKMQIVNNQFACFEFSQNVDESFPTVSFQFNGSVTLTVYPREYLFRAKDDIWCIGWQNGAVEYDDGKERILLGEFALSNKLVIYDAENQTIGWTDYNCSSSITIRDEKSGADYTVGSQNINNSVNSNSGGLNLEVGRIFYVLLAIIVGFTASEF
ncbi:Aspartic proteinase-like protein 2 [Melia azedarach]|uniref:Aspartic proteinase-like protein 2 n=1 Tax=Melia azedarach TaxID=155640 RepID=A0ACC1YFY3_MELAZ|nr:Aspartic proteinase-like protein 2 [Melia azedarach]